MTKSREKFKKLAESRVVRTIRDIRLIGNLANTNNYEYDQKDADKIIASLEDEIKMLKVKFANARKANEISFNL